MSFSRAICLINNLFFFNYLYHFFHVFYQVQAAIYYSYSLEKRQVAASNLPGLHLVV